MEKIGHGINPRGKYSKNIESQIAISRLLDRCKKHNVFNNLMGW